MTDYVPGAEAGEERERRKRISEHHMATVECIADFCTLEPAEARLSPAQSMFLRLGMLCDNLLLNNVRDQPDKLSEVKKLIERADRFMNARGRPPSDFQPPDHPTRTLEKIDGKLVARPAEQQIMEDRRRAYMTYLRREARDIMNGYDRFLVENNIFR